jgi:hypothetical protein
MEVLSLLPPKIVKKLGGLPPAAICGVLGGDHAPSSFRTNPKFVEFLHGVIQKVGPEDHELRAAAALQKDGWVYVIDLRTPDGPHGRVLPEDIIGAFEVRHGEIVQGTYWANQKHLVFSQRGLLQLPPTLFKALVDELAKLPLETES